jgi:hypothetical protein
MITAIINRMLITISSTLAEASQHDSSGRGTVYEHFGMPDDESLVSYGDASSMEEGFEMEQQV